MTWQNFTFYLKETIIHLKEYSSQEEWELTSFALKKYCQGLSQDLIDDLGANLEYLLISYQQRFDLENVYHKLPGIEKEIEEKEEESENDNNSDDEENNALFNSFNNPSLSDQKKKLKSWIEIFPSREDCLLGESRYGAVSQETYNLLGRIYENWRLLSGKEEELEKKAKKLGKQIERVLEEWFKKQAARGLSKEEGIKEKLKAWLTDYESLEDKQQQLLKEYYEKIKENVENMEKIEADLFREQKQEKGWFKNLDWKSIGVSSGIGVILILLLLFIRRYLKG